jgi:hypothetical protein
MAITATPASLDATLTLALAQTSTAYAALRKTS